MNNRFFVLLAALALLSACKSTRNITATEIKPEKLSSEEIAEKLHSRLHQYHTVDFKAKVSVKDKKTQNFTANVRMVRDSVIWASFTGTLGVEGARIIITKDTIHVLDKLKKIYYKEPFSFIYNYVPFPVTMNLLQDLLVGNHQLEDAANSEMKIDETYNFYQKEKKINSFYSISPGLFMPLTVRLTDNEQHRQVSINYDDYRPASDTDSLSGMFSFHRIVDFKSGKKIKIDVKFLRINWNEELTFPFSVGEKYEYRN
jgi:outer membrane biogenesis lipoprotein LolB